MRQITFPLSAQKLSQLVDGSLLGDGSIQIEKLSSLPEARKGTLTFLAESHLSPHLEQLEPGVIVMTNSQLVNRAIPVTFLVVSEPRRTFAEVARWSLPQSPWKGISPQAIIHPNSVIEEDVSIGPYSVVCENVVIKKGTRVYPSVYIGPGVTIGAQCELYPFVNLVGKVQLGDKVKILGGTVIGSEGFGYLESNEEFSEVPQIGGVMIEDEVRVGANCTIDRGTLGNTIIGRGTKIDDQVHIGHNCVIGRNNILCAQVGLAGSTTLKDGVILGGQVGVAGHLTIHEKAMCGGQTGVTRDLPGNQKYFSTPATPLTEALRVFTLTKKIPEILRRLRKLEENQR